MRLTLAALLAAAVVAGATPAAACASFLCLGDAVSDDSYPPGEAPLRPTVQEVVRVRQDRGLSAAAFYNDPALALAHRRDVAYEAPPSFFSWLFPPASEPHRYQDQRQVVSLRRAY
ncbi:MAG: hypothetical protein KGM15_17040 [Pseudomonadota bacterium]|nr:hypothetical protein [Pseudomonadota bacterium]